MIDFETCCYIVFVYGLIGGVVLIGVDPCVILNRHASRYAQRCGRMPPLWRETLVVAFVVVGWPWVLVGEARGR